MSEIDLSKRTVWPLQRECERANGNEDEMENVSGAIKRLLNLDRPGITVAYVRIDNWVPPSEAAKKGKGLL